MSEQTKDEKLIEFGDSSFVEFRQENDGYWLSFIKEGEDSFHVFFHSLTSISQFSSALSLHLAKHSTLRKKK